MKIKKGDNIIVNSGKDKGKKAKVLKVFPKLDLVLVEGVNVKKRHQRGGGKAGKKGQIIEKSLPIHISNVSIETAGKVSRVGFKGTGKKKVRVVKKTGKEI